MEKSTRNPIVAVTGFGHNVHHPTNKTSNPAGMIARSLPTSIHASHPLNPTGHDIDVLDGVKGGWAEMSAGHRQIRETIRTLHIDHGKEVDLFIHLGRGPWNFFSLEKLAFRQDMTTSWILSDAGQKVGYYVNPDNNDSYVRDMPFLWQDIPMGLRTEVPVLETAELASDLLQKLYSQTLSEIKVIGKHIEIRPHLEAGDLGCGFAFYESMANCHAMGTRKRVLFCHVPSDVNDEGIATSSNALLAVIGAALQTQDEYEKRGDLNDRRTQFGELT